MKKSRKDGFSLREGVTAMMAKAAGIEPDLALRGGSAATRVLGHISDAFEAGNESAKSAALQKAQQKLQAIDPRKHGQLAQSLHGRIRAMQGRGGTPQPQPMQVAALPTNSQISPPSPPLPKPPLNFGEHLPPDVVDPRFDHLPHEEQRRKLINLRRDGEIGEDLFWWLMINSTNFEPKMEIPPMPPINIEE